MANDRRFLKGVKWLREIYPSDGFLAVHIKGLRIPFESRRHFILRGGLENQIGQLATWRRRGYGQRLR